MQERGQHWGIIGGGMLGLTLALRLRQAGHQVSVLEAADGIGGLASTWQLDDVEWDRYYHVIMLSDSYLRDLLAELELDESIEWRVTRTSFFSGRALHPLNNIIDYLRLPVLGLIDKMRLALTILYASRISQGQHLESFSAEQWLTKLSGKRTYQNLWRPLLRSKLGANYRHASAAYIWSVIRRFYAARRGGMKTEMFGYVRGGYKTILAAMQTHLERQQVELKTGVKVQQVRQQNRQLTVDCTVQGAQQQLAFDRVINTCASPLAAAMCEGLSEAEQAQHSNIVYQGIVCVSMLLKRPLAGSYMTYITDESLPFTTVIELSALVNRDQLGGHHLVYLPKYLPLDDGLLQASDAEIEQQFTEALLRMYPDLQEDDIEASKVARTRHVLALATQNYSKNLPAMQTSVPGLYIINSAHIINAALSVNDTVKLAGEAVSALLKETV